MRISHLMIACTMLFIVPLENYNYAGTIDPSVPDHKYITHGKNFECVGKLCGTYKDKALFCASAVAIDDHHILTAAHVVQNSTSCFFTVNGEKYCIDKITIHKNFNDQEFGVADIAIGYSEEPFALENYPELYTDNNEVGKKCDIAGYGFYGTFNSGAKYHDDQKRAGSNVVDSIFKSLLICSPSKPGDPTKTRLEFLIASGDSGGGVFIDSQLAGINSCIMGVDKAPSAKYNEESGHTRISQFIEWINQNKTK